MKLFSNNIVPYASTEGDKIYPIVVDIKKGIKSGEAISFVTADNQVGVITVDFMDGNSSYSIEGCMVTSTIHRPDGTVLEIPCDIISQSTIEIPLGINGTYQEGVHTFDLKIVRGNGKVIGVPTMSYSVSGSLSSDGVVEGDDRLPVLTMVLDNAQDKLTRLDKAIAGATNDLEVKEARDGEVTLNARLERDLAKGKIHFVNIEGSSISTESQEGYLENVEIYGNTWQNAENLADIRSVGTDNGDGTYSYEIVTCGKNLFNGELEVGTINSSDGLNHAYTQETRSKNYIRVKPLQDITISYSSGLHNVALRFYDENKKYLGSNIDFFGNRLIKSGSTFTIPENTHYLRFKSITTDLTIKYQLEEGTQATSYEPYQERKLTILSPTPLEKVGGVADRIICKEGVWGVEKNIKTYTVSQDTVITRHNIHENGTTSYRVEGVLEQINSTVITSKFKQISFNNLYTVGNIGHASHESNMHLYVRLEGETTTTTAKQQLQGMVIKHIALTPQFIPLPHDQQIKLRTFADRTNISFLTEIEPTIKASVSKSLGATVNTHTTQIDNLNKELDRVKKLEESTVSTVTTDSSFTTITETTQGYFEDVKLEGKTLVNLAGSVNGYFNQFAVVSRTCMLLKCNTEYTAVINNKADHTVRIYGNEGSVLATPTFDVPAKTTIIKKLRTKDVVDDTGLFKSNSATDTLFKLDILLLEGDHTQTLPLYFEGLKSVGQSGTTSEDGADEIVVSSVKGDGNLLFFDKDYSHTMNGVTCSVDAKTQVITVNGTCTQDNTTFTLNDVLCNKHKYNGTYSCTVESLAETPPNVSIRFYNKNYARGISFYLQDSLSASSNYVDDEVKFSIRVNAGTTLNNTKIKVSFYKGDIKAEYVPYQSNKKHLLYYSTTTQTWEKPVLREWDSIEKHNDGKYYYHKRSGEVVLDGIGDWRIWGNPSERVVNTIAVLHPNSDVFDSYGSTTIYTINDKVADLTVDHLYSTDIEGIGLKGNDVRLKLNRDKLSSQDISGVKAWLQANPITVVYQLAQEEVYECTNLDLITYQNETNLIVNSGVIQPKLELKVHSNISNVVKLLQEKVSVLENKFIEGLKQVLAGDMMSLAHLLYPEDFEHGIQTLEL